MYVVITSFNPLWIFIYDEGLARFATEKYDSSKGSVYQHLTNYSINKFNTNFKVDTDDGGSKQTFKQVKESLAALNYDVKQLWASINDLIVKTIISIDSITNSCIDMYVPY